MDLFIVHTTEGDRQEVLNMVDLATQFQVCVPIPNKRPETVARAFEAGWATWAGVPESVVCDNGGEFYAEFQLLGRTGRPYGIYSGGGAVAERSLREERRRVEDDFTTEHEVKTADQIATACVMIGWAKNARIGDSGFSPAQLVLGRGMRLPWGLLSERTRSQLASQDAADQQPSMLTRMAMLASARQALERVDSCKRVRRALLARSRDTPPSAELRLGDAVFFFRDGRRKNGRKRGPAYLIRSWHGPAVVIGTEPSAIYVSYEGKSTK